MLRDEFETQLQNIETSGEKRMNSENNPVAPRGETAQRSDAAIHHLKFSKIVKFLKIHKCKWSESRLIFHNWRGLIRSFTSTICPGARLGSKRSWIHPSIDGNKVKMYEEYTQQYGRIHIGRIQTDQLISSDLDDYPLKKRI